MAKNGSRREAAKQMDRAAQLTADQTVRIVRANFDGWRAAVDYVSELGEAQVSLWRVWMGVGQSTIVPIASIADAMAETTGDALETATRT